MSWVYNGRKYWYHKGKKYSCKFKKRYKSKRRNYNSSSSFEYQPIVGSGSRYSIVAEFKPDRFSDETIQTWQFDSIVEAKKGLNTLRNKYKDEIIDIKLRTH